MMQSPVAFLNGSISAGEIGVWSYDAGFVLGATVSEQLRTFRGKLFKLDEHWARLRRSLEIAGISIEPDYTFAGLAAAAEEVATTNYKLLDPADDLGLALFVTPGAYPTLAPRGSAPHLNIGMTTYPLPFHLWADKYEQGERLVTSTVRQVPAECWPRELKCRSRMHYYLAEKEVRKRSPGARALLLDEHGCVNETATANVVGFAEGPGGGRLRIPRRAAVLPGITQRVTEVLALSRCEVRAVDEADDEPRRFAAEANEIWLTSTPFCVLPATTLDDESIGDGRPGPMFRKLLAAWSEEAGVDVAGQAKKFAQRK